MKFLLRQHADPDNHFPRKSGCRNSTFIDQPALVYALTHPSLRTSIKQEMIRAILPYTKMDLTKLDVEHQKVVQLVLDENIVEADVSSGSRMCRI